MLGWPYCIGIRTGKPDMKKSATETCDCWWNSRIGGVVSSKYKPVEDAVDLDDPADEFPYIRHCELKLLQSGKLAAASRRQLTDKSLRHHQLGRTYT